MSLLADFKFCLKPRCPRCRKGGLFNPNSITVVDVCAECGADLGAHDIGDGAAVFMIFLFGFTVVPLAWLLEVLFSPPIWGQALMWTAVMLAVIAILLPSIKAYIILLEYRHRKPGE